MVGLINVWEVFRVSSMKDVGCHSGYYSAIFLLVVKVLKLNKSSIGSEALLMGEFLFNKLKKIAH